MGTNSSSVLQHFTPEPLIGDYIKIDTRKIMLQYKRGLWRLPKIFMTAKRGLRYANISFIPRSLLTEGMKITLTKISLNSCSIYPKRLLLSRFPFLCYLL